MMLALYVVLGWSLAGFVVALVIGRAIALSNSGHEDAALATATQPGCARTTKSFSAARAA